MRADPAKSQLRAALAAAPVAAAAVVPVLVLLRLAFDAPFEPGGRNLRILGNTVALTGLTVCGACVLGVPLALATTCLRRSGGGIAFILLAIPLALPSYIGAFAFFAATGPGGELEALLGFAPPAVRGLAGSVWVMTLYTFPFVLLSVRASLRGLDAGIVDAARTMGLSPGGAFFRVVLPRIRGGIAAGALLVALYTLSDFATPAILGLDTFTRAIYVEYNAFGLGRAAWLSLQLLGLVAVVLFFESRARRVRESPGRTLRWTPPPAVRLGFWILVGGIGLSAVGLPVVLFLVWLLREGAGGFEPATIRHSVVPAALAAMAAVVCAVPVARAASVGRAGRWMARITAFGFGIPGIVMGTALVYVGLRLPVLYQTTAMLVLGYVLRFLPLAVGALRDGLERLEGNLPHAARSLGAGPGETFRRVSLPLVLPGVLSGSALVYLEAMRELPLTLLLRPTGAETLTTRLWQVYEAGYFGEAALPGLILIGVSSLALLLFLRSERLLGLAAESEA